MRSKKIVADPALRHKVKRPNFIFLLLIPFLLMIPSGCSHQHSQNEGRDVANIPSDAENEAQYQEEKIRLEKEEKNRKKWERIYQMRRKRNNFPL